MADETKANDKTSEVPPKEKTEQPTTALEDLGKFVDGVKKAARDIKDGKMPSGVSGILGKPLLFDSAVEKLLGKDEVEAKRVEPAPQQAAESQDKGNKAAGDASSAPAGDQGAKPEKPADQPDAKGDKVAVGPGKKVEDPDDDDLKVPPHKQKDGTVVYEWKNGDVSCYNPKDNSSVTVRSDKTVVESRTDGSGSQTDPNGDVTTWKRHDNGVVEYKLPNGDRRCEIDEHTTIVYHPDKSYDYYSPKGMRHYANGECQYVTRMDEHGNQVTEYANGSTSTKLPDKTIIDVDKDGNKTTYYPNKVIVEERKDGTKVTMRGDNSILTEKKDGTRIFEDGKGNKRVLDEDEVLRQR